MACKQLQHMTFYKGSWGTWILCITIPNIPYRGSALGYQKLPESLLHRWVWVSSRPPEWGEPEEITYEEAVEIVERTKQNGL